MFEFIHIAGKKFRRFRTKIVGQQIVCQRQRLGSLCV